MTEDTKGCGCLLLLAACVVLAGLVGLAVKLGGRRP